MPTKFVTISGYEIKPDSLMTLEQIIGTLAAYKPRCGTASMGGEKKGRRRKFDEDKSVVFIYPPIIPVSRSTWLAGVKSGRFPKPAKFGPNTNVWMGADILALAPSHSDCKQSEKAA